MALVGWWKLDGDALDASGNEEHASSTNAIVWVDGKINSAAQFNGTSSTITIPDSPSWRMFDNFSVATWVYPVGDAGHGIFNFFFYTGQGSTNHQGWQVKLAGTTGIHSAGRYVGARLWALDSAQDFVFTEKILPDSQWSHIALSVDRRNNIVNLYINGILEASRSLTVEGQLDPSGTRNLTLGIKVVGATQYLDGMMDDARIYDHALSLKEVKHLAQAKVAHWKFDYEGEIKDSSGYDVHATLDSLAPIWVNNSSIGTGAYEFNGIDSEIRIPNVDIKSGGSFTISFWSICFGTQNHSQIYRKGSSWLMARWNWYDQSRMGITVPTSGGSFSIIYVSRAVSPLNEWAHFTVVVRAEDGVFSVYRNGISVGEITGLDFTGNSIAGDMVFGGSAPCLEGVIDDPRVYATALSDDDVKELYQQRGSLDSLGNFYIHSISNPNPYREEVLKDSPVGYWRLEETSGTVAVDSSSSRNNGEYVGTEANLDVTGLIPASRSAYEIVTAGTSTNIFVDEGVTLSDSATFEFWFGSSNVPSWYRVWAWGAEYNLAIMLNRYSGNNALQVRIDNEDYGGAFNQNVITFPFAFNGTVRHVVLVFDGDTNTAYAYVDGALVNSSGFLGSITGTEQFRVGNRTSGVQSTPGFYDEVAVYDYELTQSQVSKHYELGAGL